MLMILCRLWLSLFDRFKSIFYPCPVQQWDEQHWHLSASLCRTVFCFYFVSMVPTKTNVPWLLLRIYFINEYLTLLLGNPQTVTARQTNSYQTRKEVKRKKKNNPTTAQKRTDFVTNQEQTWTSFNMMVIINIFRPQQHWNKQPQSTKSAF